MPVKNRPRIPTPDVTKEVLDRENRLATGGANIQNHVVTSGITLVPHQLSSTPYTAIPEGVIQVLLSPIQEQDGSGSVNNTLHAGQPGTAALAQTVLAPGMGPVLTTPVSLPVTVSQLTSLGLSSATNSPLLTSRNRSPPFMRAFQQHNLHHSPLAQHVVVTEIPSPPDDEAERNISSRSSETSAASDVTNGSKESKTSERTNASNTTGSVVSNTTASIASARPAEPDDPDPPVTSNLVSLLPNTSSPASIISLDSSEENNRSRKTSVASQSNNNNNNSGSSAKRGEVYV